MTTTTAPAAPTARSITTAVRRALRLAGALGHVLKVSTQANLENRRTEAGAIEQTHVWRTLVETFNHTKDVADALTAAGYTVFSKSEQPGSQQFVALIAPRVAEVDTTPTNENPETNTHHVKYTNVGGYDGTVLIERGDTRRTHALEQAASIRRSGGHVHSITEITSRGRRITVVEPVPAADELATDDYRGDDAALATDLRIAERLMGQEGRAPGLVAEDRRHRLHLLRIGAARTARAGLRTAGAACHVCGFDGPHEPFAVNGDPVHAYWPESEVGAMIADAPSGSQTFPLVVDGTTYGYGS